MRCADGWVKVMSKHQANNEHRYHPFTFCHHVFPAAHRLGHVLQVLPMRSEECLNCTLTSLSLAVSCCASCVHLLTSSSVIRRNLKFSSGSRRDNDSIELDVGCRTSLKAPSPRLTSPSYFTLPVERGLVGRSPQGIQRSRWHSVRCPRWHVRWRLVEHEQRSGDATPLGCRVAAQMQCDWTRWWACHERMQCCTTVYGKQWRQTAAESG